MTSTAPTTLLQTPTLPVKPSGVQVHLFTGKELTVALERHYKALSAQINTRKLHNNKLSNAVLIKNTAINSLTFGEYGKLYDHQKTLRADPVEQKKTQQLIRDIETKYTTAPHTIALCNEIKALASNFNFIIEINNKTLAELDKKTAATLAEKQQLRGRETDTFKTLSDKIIDLPADALYQSQFVNQTPALKR